MPAPRRRRARRANLSQHFLRKGATAARLVQRTSIGPTDTAVEIGAGRGALTIPLARRAGQVIAVEIDPVLAKTLQPLVPDNVTVVRADFLLYSPPPGDYKVVGNLPYAQTTDIVRSITRAVHPPDDAWLVMQKEAAHRFIGMPYRNETLWSLRLKPWWHIERTDQLRKHDFDPPPGVDSVMVWFARRTRPLLTPQEGRFWLLMLETLFSAGEPVGRSVDRWLTRRQLKRLSRDLNFSDQDRPPRLSFEQWLGLFRFIHPPGGGDIVSR